MRTGVCTGAAIVCATLFVANTFGGLDTTPSAEASTDIAISGTYVATYIGDWARTNSVYRDEQVVRSTWTISSSCATAQDCEGRVTSDQGWSARLYMHDGSVWWVQRDVPDWETCEDGSTFSGYETIYFYPTDMTTGTQQPGSPILGGRVKTVGPSGACGINKPLTIDMPFRLDKVS